MLLAYLFNLNNSLLNQAISPFSTGLISSVSSFNIRVISHCSAYSNFVVLFLMCVLYFREEKTLSTPASNLAQPRTSLDPTATDFFGQRSAWSAISEHTPLPRPHCNRHFWAKIGLISHLRTHPTPGPHCNRFFSGKGRPDQPSPQTPHPPSPLQ